MGEPAPDSLLVCPAVIRRLLGFHRNAELPWGTVTVVARPMLRRREVLGWLVEQELATDEAEARAQIRAMEEHGGGPGRRRARRRAKVSKADFEVVAKGAK